MGAMELMENLFGFNGFWVGGILALKGPIGGNGNPKLFFKKTNGLIFPWAGYKAKKKMGFPQGGFLRPWEKRKVGGNFLGWPFLGMPI